MFKGEVPVFEGLPSVEGLKLYMRILLPVLFFIIIVHVDILIIWPDEIVEFFFWSPGTFTSHKHPRVPDSSHRDAEIIIDNYITILILICEVDINRRERGLLPQTHGADHVPREHLVLAARHEIRHAVRHERLLRVHIDDLVGLRLNQLYFSGFFVFL
jgi:hypothetical protein